MRRRHEPIIARCGQAAGYNNFSGAERVMRVYPRQVNTGGRYNPITDSWEATSAVNVPSPRDSHTAVWTGSEMIVWGGFSDPGFWFNNGGRYDPNTDSWMPTSTMNAPEARWDHTVEWTGDEMIVWVEPIKRSI